MSRVMIECPNTGHVVPTGLRLDERSYAGAMFQTSIIAACLDCGHPHTFAKQDAWVEDESGGK